MRASRKVALASLLLVLLPALPALAGTEIATGDRAVWPEVKEMVNLASFSGRDMDGRVVLLEIFRTWDPASKAQAVRLDELHARYGERGLMVLAVTNEGKGPVDRFVADAKCRHPVLVEAGDSAGTYGIGGFPHAILVDAEGIVAWEGFTGALQDSEIESLLAAAHPLPRLPKRFASIQKSLENRDYAAARKDLLALLDGPALEGADRKSAEGAVKWIADRGASLLSGAEANSRAENFHGAAGTLRRTAESFKGFEEAVKATGLLEELLKNPAAKREIEAGDLWQRAKVAGKKAKPAQAALAFRAFAKKWEGTRAAEKASAAATALEAQARK